MQVVGQLMPAGLLVTVPCPEIATVNCGPAAVKVADTDWLLESVSWHEDPVHAPPKPANWKPVPAVAVSATEVPEGKLAVQVVGQLIPAGALVTVPVPVTETVN